MSGKIFINYRRGDAPDSTGRLYDRLEGEFTAGDLFMDVEGHIKPGDDFVEVLGRQVAQCDVLLAVIGPHWSDLLAARNNDPDDFVAVEIKAAIEQGKRVIPVLVGGAGMPRAETLPEPIRPLARRNAVGLRPERFKADCQGLISALKEQLAAAEQERAARTDAERKVAEAERKRREAEEAARLVAAEERARAQSAAGLSPEVIRKAEELVNWDFIKERSDIQALRDHLARFPSGVTTLEVTKKLDELVWASLGQRPYPEKLRTYLEEFPQGAHSDFARKRLADLEQFEAEARFADERRAKETAEWGAVAASTDKSQIEAFLKKWPNGSYAEAASRTLTALRSEEASKHSFLPFVGGAALGLFVGTMILIVISDIFPRNEATEAVLACLAVGCPLVLGSFWISGQETIAVDRRMAGSSMALAAVTPLFAIPSDLLAPNQLLPTFAMTVLAWLISMYVFFRYKFRR